MINSKCVICDTEFEPRKNKKYCSDACKQKAHNDSKAKVEMDKVLESELKIKQVFKRSDFEEAKKKGVIKKLKLNMVEFFFVRKNLRGEFDADWFLEFCNSLSTEVWQSFNTEPQMNNNYERTFIKFNEDILNGYIVFE